MALGIGLHNGGKNIDFSQYALYLDQRFYESLFNYCKGREGSSTLKAIAAIGYDDELFLSIDQIGELLHEFEHRLTNEEFDCLQVEKFRAVLREAMTRSCGIVIWGDMYPDLSRRL